MSDTSADCIFCKIVKGEVGGDVLHRDDLVTAFRDIRPAAPVHILVVPNHHVEQIAQMSEADAPVLGRMVAVANELARREGIDRSGYRLLVNNGPDSGQVVYHVHLHLIGGRNLGGLVGRA